MPVLLFKYSILIKYRDFLTKEHQAHITFVLASAVSVYLDSVETSWCIANQDRISVKFRGFVDSILSVSCTQSRVSQPADELNRREGFDPTNAFVVADSIADIAADIFNKLKVTIDDEYQEGPDHELNNDADICGDEREDDEIASNGTSTMAVRLNSPGADSMTFESESEEEIETIINDENNQGDAQNVDTMMIEAESDKENRPVFRFAIESDEDEDMADETPADEDMAAGDQERGVRMAIDQPITKDTPAAAWTGLGEEEDEDFQAINLEGGNKTKKSSNTSQAMELDEGIEAKKEGDKVQQVNGTAIKKGKGPRKGPKSTIDHFNNPLYSVVMGENSSWPPKHYKCKIEGCESQGKEGAWRSLRAHFEHRHAEQWKEATGCEAKEQKCPVPGCSYTTKRPIYIPRHLKSHHPGYKAAPAKNGRKNKRC